MNEEIRKSCDLLLLTLTDVDLFKYVKWDVIAFKVLDHGNHKYSLNIWLNIEYCAEKNDFGEGKQLMQPMIFRFL